MDADPTTTEKEKTALIRPRPLLLTMLCLASFVYFALMAGLFMAGIIYSGWITGVTNTYIPEDLYTKTEIRLMFIAGFVLHSLAFSGSVLIWRLRKAGFYLLGVSCLAMASLQLLQPQFTVASTFLYIFFLFSFGLYFRRLR